MPRGINRLFTIEERTRADKRTGFAERTFNREPTCDSTKGIMFGHHDDTVYGIGWEFDEGGSDVQKYAAIIRPLSALILERSNSGEIKALIKYLSRKYARKSSTNITGEAWYL